MLELDDAYMLERPFHTRKFRHIFDPYVVQAQEESDEDFAERQAKAEKDKAILNESCFLTPDGSILAISKQVAAKWLKDPDVRKVRYGLKKLPNKVSVETADDFFKLMTTMIPLVETV